MRNVCQPPSTTHRQADTAGFTIIETLIVLAIAGMILLIVFLAIPALLRNSRNNQRRQDIQTILAAVSHYELSNSGNMPSICGPGQSALCTQSGGGPNPNDYFLQYDQSKLTYYQPNGISLIQQSTAPNGRSDQPPVTSQPGVTTPAETVQIYNYEQCSSTTAGGAAITGAGYNDIVALYAIEGGNGVTPQCQQL